MYAEDSLDNILKDLLSSIPEMKGAIIATKDGLPIASALPPYIDESLMTKLVSFLFEQTEKLGRQCGESSNCEFNVIRFESEYAVTRAIGKDVILTVLIVKDIKLGLVFLDIRRACERISELMIKNK